MAQHFSSHIFWACRYYLTGLNLTGLNNYPDYMVFPQPTDARRALPCWDEPLLKATFSVTLISRKGTVSLSNMPARSEAAVANKHTEALFEGVKDGSWHVTSFETTPPVSMNG